VAAWPNCQMFVGWRFDAVPSSSDSYHYNFPASFDLVLARELAVCPDSALHAAGPVMAVEVLANGSHHGAAAFPVQAPDA
jgi:hypothetical protein